MGLGVVALASRRDRDMFGWCWDSHRERPQGQSGGCDLGLKFASTRPHYNYYRDYDPTLGRYFESDPLGLEGGYNTFGYVLGNPLRYTDRRALANGPAAAAMAVKPCPQTYPSDKCDVWCTGLTGHPLVTCTRVECSGGHCSTTNFTFANWEDHPFNFFGRFRCITFDRMERNERAIQGLHDLGPI